MQDVRMYCGLMMFQRLDKWYCVDGYSMQVKCSGTYEECDEYFNNYIEELANRD